MKCDGTRAEIRFLLSAKRPSPFKSAGASVYSTAGRRAVHIILQGSYCSCKPVLCSHVKLTGYPFQSLVSPFTPPPVRHRVPSHFKRSLPLTCLSAWNNSAPTGRIFMKPDILVFFENLSRKVEISLKSDNNNGYFT